MHRTAMTAAWVVAGMVALSSCSTGWGTAPVASSTVSSPPGAASSEPTANTAATQVVVTVSMDGHGWRAHLNDSQAAQALASRLPLTLTFRDFAQGFDEKIADLDQPLPFDQMSSGDDPSPGQIAYWSPDQRLVLYWGDVARYDGIHVIGAFDDPAAQSAVQALSPDSQVTITRAE